MRYRNWLVIASLACICTLPMNAQSLITGISVPGTPNGIAVNPNNNRVYAAIPNLSTGGSAMAVIDGNTNTLIDTISLPAGAADFVGVNIVTGRVYSASSNTVTVMDGTTDKVLDTITVAGSPTIGIQGIAVDSLRNRIYVSDDNNYEIAAIDGSTNTVSYIYTHNTEALGLAVDFTTGQLLITPSGGALDIYNPATHAMKQALVGQINQAVAVNSFTGLAYVTNNAGSTLGVVNLADDKNVANITVGGSPFGVCVDYLSNMIFVAVPGSQTVVAINGSNNKVVGSVNASANYLDVNPVSRMVYAGSTNPGDTVVYVISE